MVNLDARQTIGPFHVAGNQYQKQDSRESLTRILQPDLEAAGPVIDCKSDQVPPGTADLFRSRGAFETEDGARFSGWMMADEAT
eukprot:s985_g10.t1